MFHDYPMQSEKNKTIAGKIHKTQKKKKANVETLLNKVRCLEIMIHEI